MSSSAAAKKRKGQRVHTCGICGAPLKDERWIYSSHTGERYCPVPEWNACGVRADKRRGITT